MTHAYPHIQHVLKQNHKHLWPRGNQTNFFVSFPGDCLKHNHKMFMISIDVDVLENQRNVKNDVPFEERADQVGGAATVRTNKFQSHSFIRIVRAHNVHKNISCVSDIHCICGHLKTTHTQNTSDSNIANTGTSKSCTTTALDTLESLATVWAMSIPNATHEARTDNVL